MSDAGRAESFRRVETLIGNLLRYGVVFCAILIAIGLLQTFVFGAGDLASFLSELLSGKVLSAGRAISFAELFSLSTFSDPHRLVCLGLLFLILLPVTRVALTLVVFLLQRDAIYVGISSVVLAVLLFGLLFGKHL